MHAADEYNEIQKAVRMENPEMFDDLKYDQQVVLIIGHLSLKIKEINKWERPEQHICNRCGGAGVVTEQQGRLL